MRIHCRAEARLFMGLIVLLRDHVAGPLMVHDSFAPRPLDSYVASGARPLYRQSDILSCYFWSAVREQNPIRLLIGIGELGITEPCEDLERTHYADQFEALLRIGVTRFRARISPGLIRIERKCDSAVFCEHDRL